MAKKKIDESPLSAFEGVIGNLSGNYNIGGDSINLDDTSLDKDDDSVVDLSKKPIKTIEEEADVFKELDNKDLDLPAEKDEDDDLDEEDEDVEPIKPVKKDKVDKTPKDDENKDQDNDTESSSVGLFFDAFLEALGWEVDSEEKKPDTVESLIEYMKDLVESSTEMDYADDRVKELDEFVKNGGKFEDYYKVTQELTDLDKINIEDETIQKQIIREDLKNNGYTDKQIERKLDRYEEAGVLEDEATDSVERLKEVKAKLKELALEQLKQARLDSEKAQTEFYSSVMTTIDDLKEIRGIKIPVEDRKKLKEYAFKVESDGKTKYQKEYGKDIAKNFIESVYFTMKGDALVKTAKSSGETSAVEKLRQSMKNKKIGGSKLDMDNSSATPIWKAASSFFGSK